MVPVVMQPIVFFLLLVRHIVVAVVMVVSWVILAMHGRRGRGCSRRHRGCRGRQHLLVVMVLRVSVRDMLHLRHKLVIVDRVELNFHGNGGRRVVEDQSGLLFAGIAQVDPAHLQQLVTDLKQNTYVCVP